jgi:hypothetical protein
VPLAVVPPDVEESWQREGSDPNAPSAMSREGRLDNWVVTGRRYLGTLYCIAAFHSHIHSVIVL